MNSSIKNELRKTTSGFYSVKEGLKQSQSIMSQDDP